MPWKSLKIQRDYRKNCLSLIIHQRHKPRETMQAIQQRLSDMLQRNISKAEAAMICMRHTQDTLFDLIETHDEFYCPDYIAQYWDDIKHQLESSN